MDDDADPSGRSLAGTMGWNPAKGMYVSCELLGCQVEVSATS